MSTFLTLIKREYWEHKTGLQWVPMIVGGIIVFGVFLAVFVFANSDVRINSVGSYSITDLFGLYDASVSPEQKRVAIQMGSYSSIISFAITLGFVSFFYCLGALYDDRKDKSILFWKSLPVSDSQTVLSKVATVMLLAPFAFWVVLVASNLIVMLLATLFAWFSDASAWDSIWAPSNFFGIAGYQLLALYVATLWAAPVIGYLLLVSSWTKKVPFLVATVPVVLLIIAESIIFKSANVAGYIGERLAGIWNAIMTPFASIAGDFAQAFNMDDEDWIAEKLTPSSYFEQLMDLDLWFGLVAAALFIIGAIYIRRYRDEAL
ncbi:MAG: hypothetical protein HWD86_07765 [Kangiellaceae bacterium]|nr:hypothetical protein [Kangiellaceae bacterium]